jgi:hypothetical protein
MIDLFAEKTALGEGIEERGGGKRMGEADKRD